MNENLEHLIVLQAQDLEIQRLRREIAAIPDRKSAAQKSLASADAAVEANRTALLAEEKLRRGQESEIASQRSKIARLRRSLDGATSAAQIAAFEHEITFSQAAATRLEEEEFSSLERTEALEAEAEKLRTRQDNTRQSLEEETNRGTQLLAESQSSLAGLTTQCRELRAQVAEPWLGTYDRLQRAKGTAVAEALGNATAGKCAACQMAVRPQRWQDLTGRDHTDTIFTCESCGRLLFWDPRRDTPRPWEAGDRLRRATTGSPQ